MFDPNYRIQSGPLAGKGLYEPDVIAALKAKGISSDRRVVGMDAQSVATTSANNGPLAWMLNYHDPDALKVLFSPLAGAEVFGGGEQGERKLGSFADKTVSFSVVEMTGEASAYGDYNNNGSAGFNVNFPQRQTYNFQTILQYGVTEAEMLAPASINVIGLKRDAANWVINQNMNTIYFYGVSGLQNYGILNDPSLPAAVQPGPKAYGSAANGPWQTSGVTTATPNEIYTDVLTLYTKLVTQSGGNVQLSMNSPLTLALSPASQAAIQQTNSFGISAAKLIKDNLPNIRFVTAIQYATTAGNLVQLIADEVQGQKTGYVAYTEKLRAFPIIPGLSSFSQKVAAGSCGCILRQGFAVAQMLGV